MDREERERVSKVLERAGGDYRVGGRVPEQGEGCEPTRMRPGVM